MMKFKLGHLLFFVVVLMYACKSKEPSTSNLFKMNQIEIDLADKMNPQRIVASFPNFGLMHKCTLNKVTNLSVFEFDPNTIGLEKLVDFLSKEVGVESCNKTKGCSL